MLGTKIYTYVNYNILKIFTSWPIFKLLRSM